MVNLNLSYREAVMLVCTRVADLQHNLEDYEVYQETLTTHIMQSVFTKGQSECS